MFNRRVFFWRQLGFVEIINLHTKFEEKKIKSRYIPKDSGPEKLANKKLLGQLCRIGGVEDTSRIGQCTISTVKHICLGALYLYYASIRPNSPSHFVFFTHIFTEKSFRNLIKAN